MCIIMYVPEGEKFPTQEAMDNSRYHNLDNMGYMFLKPHKKGDGQRIVIRKYVKYQAFLDNLAKDKAEYAAKSPFVIHFRDATHGVVNLENTHPFRIDDDVAFCHNGHIAHTQTAKGSTISDTVNFCKTVLKELPKNWWNHDGVFTLMDKFIAHSKLVFLHRNGGVKIVGEDKKDAHWKDGVWYSNDYYKMARSKTKIVDLYTGEVTFPPTKVATTTQRMNGTVSTTTPSQGAGMGITDIDTRLAKIVHQENIRYWRYQDEKVNKRMYLVPKAELADIVEFRCEYCNSWFDIDARHFFHIDNECWSVCADCKTECDEDFQYYKDRVEEFRVAQLKKGAK